MSLGALTPSDVTEAAGLGDRRPAADGNRSGADGFDRRVCRSCCGPRSPPRCRPTASLRRTPSCEAAKFALIERLRRVDEPVLDTLLVSSLSPELGPDDVAAALRLALPTRRSDWWTAPAPAG